MPRRKAAEGAETDPAAQALSDFLRRHIRDNYTSTRAAAREWDMNDSTIGKIINDPKRVPEPETMRQLAAGMHMSLGELYALAGLSDPPEVEAADRELLEAAIRGLSNADLRVLSRMTPAQKVKWMESARSLLGE